MNLFELNTESDFSFVLQELGRDIKINGTPARALITSYSFNENEDSKYITSLDIFGAGDLININEENYLVLSYRKGQSVPNKGIMKRCNYNVKFDNMPELPAIIESQSYGLDTTEKIILATGKIIVTLQSNENTNNIFIDDTFIKMGFEWKVTGIDKTVPGLVKLHCDLVQSINYDINILNSEPLIVRVDEIKQLNVETLKNGTATDFDVVYSASNDNVSVDSSGNITGVSYGNAVVTAEKADDSNVYDSINVEVTEINITISGNIALDSETSYDYSCSVESGNTIISDAVGLWSIDYNGNSTDVATLQNTSGNTVTLDTGTTTCTIFLTVAWQEDNSVTDTMEISIDSGDLW